METNSETVEYLGALTVDEIVNEIDVLLDIPPTLEKLIEKTGAGWETIDMMLERYPGEKRNTVAARLLRLSRMGRVEIANVRHAGSPACHAYRAKK